ncbi:hypothetical protein IGI04_029979 [Brassica rapa subsp. trilocularis]|uniref:Uncharacterized protein n=1 Tax=Brassica rapa subsp. trilocularis TaxID=1813537 RepID=A0ABQ7LS53_BRACM|nr:hypothetical protein IGI04_029979 [Brassica rapa subsp. trilocularis]
MVYAWSTRKDKCQVSADKYGSFEDNFVTFRHRKSTKTSSRFLPVNTKGNDKSYQNPVSLAHYRTKEISMRKGKSRKKETQQNDYLARSLRSDRAHTLLGRYVATEHAHCSRPSTHTLLGRYVATEHAHTARSLRSDRARTHCSRPSTHTLLGRYVATEHAHTARSLRSDRARTLLSRYVATELKPTLHSLRSDLLGRQSLRSDLPQRGPPLRSPLNPHRNAFFFVSIGVPVEILRRKQRPFRPSVATHRPVRPQRGPPLRSPLNPHRNAFRFVSIGVSVEILRRKQRPVRPQRGPPLRSPLNPHRNAFRFVSIGVSIEILRRKQVGLFLACFHSLRSDMSDRQSLRSDLSGLKGVLLCLFVSSQSEFPLRFYDENKWDSSRLLPLAIATEMASYVATCQASKGSSFAFSFESSSKRFSFRLNRSFR